jgi:hypothetical protein
MPHRIKGLSCLRISYFAGEQLLSRISDPPLHRFCGISGRGVEADLRVRCVFVDQIDAFLEQQQLWRRAKPGADHHAVEAPRLEMADGNRLGGFTEIDHATLDLIAEAAQALELRIDECPDEIGR